MTKNRMGRYRGLFRFSFIMLSMAAFFPFITFMAGCSSSSGIKQYVRPDVDVSALRTIAVLPLRNFTADNHASEKIRSKINIELLSRGVEVIEPGEIDLTLRELKIRSMETLRRVDIIDIGSTLRADAVIAGSVGEFNINQGITVSYPEVSMNLMMFETVSGNTLWSAWNTSGGPSFATRHFGAETRTLEEVAVEVIKETFDALY